MRRAAGGGRRAAGGGRHEGAAAGRRAEDCGMITEVTLETSRQQSVVGSRQSAVDALSAEKGLLYSQDSFLGEKTGIPERFREEKPERLLEGRLRFSMELLEDTAPRVRGMGAGLSYEGRGAKEWALLEPLMELHCSP